MSNGYNAQDMATQGADGFRNGYQAGYADAVKAVEAGKPAAAQEAADYQYRIIVKATGLAGDWLRADKEQFNKLDGYACDHYAIERRELYAAPVAAAPGIDMPAMPVATDREPDDSMPAGYFESNLDWARRPENIEALDWFIENHTAIRRLIDASPKGDTHPDDAAVDAFAAAMKSKLAAARAKGRAGWAGDEPGMQRRLSDMLRDHVEKGDPRDVANFCMFLHQRGEAISPKGGSDAQDAARWRVAREQNGVTISVEEADDDGDMHFVSGHTPEELDAAMDALQATSAEVGGMSALTVQEAVVRLEQIANAEDVPYPHWLGGDDADQGLSYCYECAEKAVAAGLGEFVDGGWPQDNDGSCHCEDCGKLLDYTLTDYGVGEELSHFKGIRLRGKLDPETAYHLARLLEHHNEHPEVKSILPKVRRALARTEQPTSHGEGVSDAD